MAARLNLQLIQRKAIVASVQQFATWDVTQTAKLHASY
jgi:hypothetical protein